MKRVAIWLVSKPLNLIYAPPPHKNKRLEKPLNQLDALTADATDKLIKVNEATEAIAAKLILIQNEIEQIYITLDEPLLYGKDKKE